ncbi:c-type cytochrome [soil metagenome]
MTGRPASFVRFLAIGTTLVSAPLRAQGTASADPLPVPSWAFPTTSPDAPALKAPFDSIVLLHVPTSRKSYTMAQVKNQNAPPDWYPAAHPPVPEPVAHGRVGAMMACGYCHLPDGQGRTENATLAGLPAEYMMRQLDDLKTRARRGALDSWASTANMHRVADSVTQNEALAASRYFARIKAKPRFHVVEGAEVPVTYQAGLLYAVKPGAGTEPLGQRIIEVADDVQRHELRDAKATYTAYVPAGSIVSGKRLATVKEKVPLRACASCHGPALLGVGQVPPIAGRSPTYLFRQLLAFRNGTRAATTSAPMQSVAASLSLDEMIAVVAYAGSLRPSR